MTKLKVQLDRGDPAPDGEFPIAIKISHDRQQRAVKLKYRVKQEEWDYRKSQIDERVGSSEYRRFNKRRNILIESELLRLKKIVLDLEMENISFTADDILNKYRRNLPGMAVHEYINNIVQSLHKVGKNGNAMVYDNTQKVLLKFYPRENLTFEEINYSFLRNFEMYLQGKEVKVNTISFYMRTLRSIYNRAIKDGIAKEESYPFKNMVIRKEKTVKRAIYKEEIATVKDLDLAFCSRLDLARDIFLFSFYMRGMSFKDIVFLKVGNIIGDRLYYSRQKTSQKLNIKLTDKAWKLIRKYSPLLDPDEYIFPLILRPGDKEFSQYRNAYRKINTNLKRIGFMVGTGMPLTTYVARHSWASIAKRSGIPTSVISEGLGHDSEKTTQIYLDSFENSVLDAANEIVTNI
ncbi:MAG: site-specific integrase [Culturomica sp.]|jgi:integrase|nr:site-specific integrase [Culturomica sp.]